MRGIHVLPVDLLELIFIYSSAESYHWKNRQPQRLREGQVCKFWRAIGKGQSCIEVSSLAQLVKLAVSLQSDSERARRVLHVCVNFRLHLQEFGPQRLPAYRESMGRLETATRKLLSAVDNCRSITWHLQAESEVEEEGGEDTGVDDVVLHFADLVVRELCKAPLKKLTMIELVAMTGYYRNVPFEADISR